MAFTIDVTGIDELNSKLDQLSDKALGIAAQGLYEGAGVVADKVSGAVQGIATAPFKYAKNGQKRMPSPEEKAIVASSRHGVAKFRKGGINVETSVGYQNSGYAQITWNHARTNVRTKYKVGKNGMAKQAGRTSEGTSSKPIPLIVNSINSGTSFMEKQPFLRKAFSQSKGAAEAAIENKIKELIDEIDIG